MLRKREREREREKKKKRERMFPVKQGEGKTVLVSENAIKAHLQGGYCSYKIPHLCFMSIVHV